MSWWTSSGEETSVPDPVRAVVVLVGWGIFLLPIFGLSVLVFLSFIAAGIYLVTNPSAVRGVVGDGDVAGLAGSATGGISNDLALIIGIAAVGVSAYLVWSFLNLLQVATFGEETVEEARDQAQQSVEAATDTAEDISETVDEVSDG